MNSMRNITQLFKALSDPTRVRILWMLQTGGELCVCDLMEVLDLPQSTVSRHLAYLRNAGLAKDQRRGVWMFYRLPDETGAVLTGILTVLRSAAKEMKQAAVDRRHLSEYLAGKDTDACSR
ncbi:MAG: metalloregulator ArsR/SmtB family transcription factor [Desulfobacterales bacterium]|nr:metalloregulator ArsR/SmtB family transcription factor [Desulfobacterales bacterium]